MVAGMRPRVAALRGRLLSSSSGGGGAQRMPLVDRALGQFADRDAVVNRRGEFFSYEDLGRLSGGLASKLQNLQGGLLRNERVAFLCEPGEEYVAAQWAAWRSGACAVPLCLTHPDAELDFVVENSEARYIVADEANADKAQRLADRLGRKIIMTEETRNFQGAEAACEDAPYTPEDPAMLIFTSGTTGRPKGVVTRFLSLDAQVNDQRTMWGWTADDRVLNVLPLHHVHGVINMTAVPLYSGACVEYMVPDATRIWQRFRMGPMAGPLSLFMAVPTIYAKLIQAYETFSEADQRACSAAARDLRLMVSGSAALPTTIMRRWEEITGHVLLERWGMTECAMGLSNPLEPVSARLPGYVGKPMPSARLRIVNEDTGKEVDMNSGESGELRITGDIVFKEYWNRPDATAEAFDEDGWFKTGDIAAYDPEKDSFRILGRASADIIKTGGYKVSANEIERELLDHPAIREIAVLGLPDEVYGERVAAVLVLRPDQPAPSDQELRAWAKERIASYKAPSTWLFLDDEIPKNAMGKVAKKQLRKDLFGVE